MNISKFKLVKKVLIVILILLIIFIAISFIKGFRSHSLKIWNDNSTTTKSIDVVDNKIYSKYESKVNANFEGLQTLAFSFVYNNQNKIEQGKGDQEKWFKILDKEKKNYVTLYFTYEGGRGWSIQDYVQNVINKNKDSNTKIQDVKFVDEEIPSVKYVLNEKENTEYYISSIKAGNGEPWLYIVENTKADSTSTQELSRDIVRSFEIK
ncbi:MAG: hypothetical protein WCO35_03900 [Candidatus Nomurabacteria bacterium]